MMLVTKDLLLPPPSTVRLVLRDHAGRGVGGREKRGRRKKKVWVRMQRSAPFHPEMFISLIPTEGKCTPLRLMVG